jgi:ESCRT-I complex subunit TSG101
MDWGTFLQKAGYLYPDIPRVATEITRVTSSTKTLYPSVDSFMTHEGKSNTLIKLIGTVPIRFRGNMYNIPVCVWLVQNFPLVAPLVYVQVHIYTCVLLYS